jgi:hypothetical protein
MLAKLTRCAKPLWSRLSSAANQLFRRLTQPASPNLVTGALADLPRSRAELLAENALLRQKLIVIRQRTKTPRLTWRAVVLVVPRPLGSQLEASRANYQTGHIATLAPRGFSAVQEVEVAHASSNAATAPGSRNDCVDTADGSRESNGGAERIRGEWLKLNIKVEKRTIQKYMQAVRSKPPTVQSWSTFLKTHGKDI